MAEIISFADLKKQSDDSKIFTRWVNFYQEQPHEEVLDALVHEHENDFPLRSSEEPLDQLRHKALIHVLQSRARTDFLKSFLDEINQSLNN